MQRSLCETIPIMKKTFILLAFVAVLSFSSGCISVKRETEPAATTTTTTTARSTLVPSTTTVERTTTY